MNIPIIRFEVEGMKHSVLTALTEYAAQMDTDIHQAVEEFCTPQNLAAVIREAAHRHARAAIDKEIHDFFLYGQGRQYVKDAVKDALGVESECEGAAPEGE